MHGLFCLLQRPVRDTIDSAGLLTGREALSGFLQDFMPAFESKVRGSWCTLHDIYTPMSPHRGLPFVTIEGETFRGEPIVAAAQCQALSTL